MNELSICHDCAGAWGRQLGEQADFPRFTSRAELFRYVNAAYLADGDAAVDFFEFGVASGRTLSQWCALNRNRATRLFGFDWFKGLPEDWKLGKPKGTFSTGGVLPSIDDARVEIVVGLFQESLPAFLETYRPGRPVVIHNDCDLYSSTLYCLTRMHDVLAPGTIVMFDEFNNVLHESRALRDYASAYMRDYTILAATTRLTQTVVKLL